MCCCSGLKEAHWTTTSTSASAEHPHNHLRPLTGRPTRLLPRNQQTMFTHVQAVYAHFERCSAHRRLRRRGCARCWGWMVVRGTRWTGMVEEDMEGARERSICLVRRRLRAHSAGSSIGSHTSYVSHIPLTVTFFTLITPCLYVARKVDPPPGPQTRQRPPNVGRFPVPRFLFLAP